MSHFVHAIGCIFVDQLMIHPTEVFNAYYGRSKFNKYGITYSITVLMQQLGIGLRGVVVILSFLGIVAGMGDFEK